MRAAGGLDGKWIIPLRYRICKNIPYFYEIP